MAPCRLAGPWRPLTLIATAGLALTVAGCASTIDVRTLATERVDISAYELSGRDLQALQREASQLCPQGGEILRQSARDQRLEAVDSRMDRWVHFSSTWIAPPERSAQLVVLCHPAPNRQRVVAAAGNPPAPASSAAAPVLAPSARQDWPATPTTPAQPGRPPGEPAPPIGPVTVEW